MKMNKLMLGACVFSLGIATAASSYHVKIVDSTWIGQTELKPGEYDVKVDDAGKVTFKMGKNVIEAPAKVETNASKFSDTMMNTKTVNGQSQLKELDLGGTKSKLTFAEGSAAEAGTR
jgi:phenylpropionate dioxygenase-like ring-hydroxylating dioxygenase large terminal subunit